MAQSDEVTGGSATGGGAAGAADVKVVDRRWWARGEHAAGDADAPASKPTYVEELERRLAEKDRLLQEHAAKYKTAAEEFEQARLRGRREIAREVERARRALLVDLLDVVDNLDRALDAAGGASNAAGLLQGVELVRQQFLARLESFGVQAIDALHEPFDPSRHDAVSVVPAPTPADDERVVSVVRRGYRIGEDVLRPAMVVVGRS